MELADTCTGEDIANALHAEAGRRGVSTHALVRLLSPDPHKWLWQVSVALRPKGHTIERVRAVLAGETPPAPPTNKFQASPRKTTRNMVRPVRPPQLPSDELGLAGTAALRANIAAETVRGSFHRWVAQSTGTVANPPPVDRPATVERFTVTGDDRRPFARGRDPCPRCNTRGDIGCRHQRPDPALPQFQGLDPP